MAAAADELAGIDNVEWTRPTELVRVELEVLDEVEALMELLLGLGAEAVQAEPASSEDALEVMRAAPGDAAPLWKRSVVSALFAADADLEAVALSVATAFDLPAPPILRPEPLADRDWMDHVQRCWPPLALGASFEVRLPWHDAPPGDGGAPAAHGRLDEGRMVVRLEGGVAFGLGDHPTTQGAAVFLERAVPASVAARGACRVLDYGTGSGVLAVCAALLGAESAVGCDVDERSLESAVRSAPLNFPDAARAAVVFRASPREFSEAEAFAAALAAELGPFDLVVANILRRPLVALAPALAAATRCGDGNGSSGQLALTGLRGALGDLEAICKAYEPYFEDFQARELEGGWLLVEARRCEAVAVA